MRLYAEVHYDAPCAIWYFVRSEARLVSTRGVNIMIASHVSRAITVAGEAKPKRRPTSSAEMSALGDGWGVRWDVEKRGLGLSAIDFKNKHKTIYD